MQNWQNTTVQKQTVAVLLFPRFSNYCLANAIEPLRAANELARADLYDWTFVSPDGAQVTSSSGLPVLPANSLRDFGKGDALFVLPSFDVRRHATPELSRMLRSAAPRFEMVAGMDTGPWLLAQAELLDGRRATIHPDEFLDFSETFDQVDAVMDRFVSDGPIATCGGALSTLDLVLDMIRRVHGETLSLEIAAYLMAAPTEPASHLRMIGRRNELVDACLSAMSANLETPLTIRQLSQVLGTSQRKLSEAFRSHVGTPPQTIYKRLRLSAARRYAEQARYQVAEIAVRTGYATPAALTRAFVQEFGMTPTAMRRNNGFDPSR